MPSRPLLPASRPSVYTIARVAFVCLLAVSALLVVDSYATASTGNAAGTPSAASPAPPANGTTVIASQRGRLYGYTENGSILFENATYDAYWDVDPSPAGNATVLYTASNEIPEKQCGSTDCVRNVVERLNTTTGDSTRLFSRLMPDRGGQVRWHDADRINATRYVVAGIGRDRVFVFDSRSDQITWQWDAQANYDIDSGNEYPGDWTHLNDVEVVQNGRIMVSLRNLDQVVFLEPGHGVVANWTLGTNDDYDVLYEQHNPDYIPESRGGPAVVVADSQNNRVVEYQRVNGSWSQSWAWRDSRLQWPRDADRLPNGHTLITDSNGDRVLEVNRAGGVVWSVPAALPYEAERLYTGDESAGGESATALGLESERTIANASSPPTSPSHRLWRAVKTTAPELPLNAVLYVLPDWMGPVTAPPLALAGISILGLAGAELIRRRHRIRARLPW